MFNDGAMLGHVERMPCHTVLEAVLGFCAASTKMRRSTLSARKCCCKSCKLSRLENQYLAACRMGPLWRQHRYDARPGLAHDVSLPTGTLTQHSPEAGLEYGLKNAY